MAKNTWYILDLYPEKTTLATTLKMWDQKWQQCMVGPHFPTLQCVLVRHFPFRHFFRRRVLLSIQDYDESLIITSIRLCARIPQKRHVQTLRMFRPTCHLWPWLDPPLRTMQYVMLLPVLWMTSCLPNAHNRCGRGLWLRVCQRLPRLISDRFDIAEAITARKHTIAISNQSSWTPSWLHIIGIYDSRPTAKLPDVRLSTVSLLVPLHQQALLY